MKRDSFFDTLKGIGICLVFIGHLLPYDGILSRFIFLFHVPLFFFVSGYFFDGDRYSDQRYFLQSNIKGIVAPWITFTVVGLAVLALSGHFVFPDDDGVNGLYVRLFHNQSIGYNSSWFLSCLLLVRIAYLFTWKRGGSWLSNPKCRFFVICIVVFAMHVIGRMFSKLPNQTKLYLPFMLASVPMGFWFFGVGNLLHKIIPSFDGFKSKKLVCLLCSVVAFSATWVFASVKGHHANLAVPVFPHSLPFFVGSLCGIAGCALLAVVVDSRVFSFIGRHSLCFFMAEAHVAYFCRRMIPAAAEGDGFVQICVLLVTELVLAALVTPLMEYFIRGVYKLLMRLFPAFLKP